MHPCPLVPELPGHFLGPKTHRKAVAVVVRRVAAVVELQMGEAEHSPGKRDGSEQKEKMKPDERASDIKHTYTHYTIRSILHLGLVKFHLLLMQQRLDLCVLPSDDFE